MTQVIQVEPELQVLRQAAQSVLLCLDANRPPDSPTFVPLALPLQLLGCPDHLVHPAEREQFLRKEWSLSGPVTLSHSVSVAVAAAKRCCTEVVSSHPAMPKLSPLTTINTPIDVVFLLPLLAIRKTLYLLMDQSVVAGDRVRLECHLRSHVADFCVARMHLSDNNQSAYYDADKQFLKGEAAASFLGWSSGIPWFTVMSGATQTLATEIRQFTARRLRCPVASLEYRQKTPRGQYVPIVSAIPKVCMFDLACRGDSVSHILCPLATWFVELKEHGKLVRTLSRNHAARPVLRELVPENVPQTVVGLGARFLPAPRVPLPTAPRIGAQAKEEHLALSKLRIEYDSIQRAQDLFETCIQASINRMSPKEADALLKQHRQNAQDLEQQRQELSKKIADLTSRLPLDD